MRLPTQSMQRMPDKVHHFLHTSSTTKIPIHVNPTLLILMRWPGEEVPPVPIPNTAVKLLSADGTATSGRVGRCLIST